MEKMVTIEVLQKSQRTRPRKWIPWVCFIFGLITLALGLFFATFLFPDLPISQSILALIPDQSMAVGSITTLSQLIALVILPGAMALINFVTLIFTVKMCSYRHVYWWFGWIAVLGFIGMFLLTGFWILYFLVPFLTDIMNQIPSQVLDILYSVYLYGVLGYTAFFFLIMLFGIFYNLNYPAKYEEIYALRKARIKSFREGKDKRAYKKRFYMDYKKGNWDSMMLDLHYRAFIKDSYEPMRKDSYDFFVYYCCSCDATLKRAIFDQYAREGRFYECRTIYHDIKGKSDAVSHGAKVILPHYIPQGAEPKQDASKKAVARPAPRPVAPLAPVNQKKPHNAKLRTWSPDDI